MKNNSIIEFMEIITTNDNNHNNTQRHYLLYPDIYPNDEETALSNMQRKHQAH